ncbi:MAG: hypothetical protein FH749_04100 [Firmicutes bacterium]|nr:hypothetical protein [Bacillota bacterium]
MKEKYVRTKRLHLAANLLVGMALLAGGLLLDLVDNSRALIGLSLIPFGYALGLLINLILIKRNPQGMNPLIIAENDERVMSVRNEADSVTFRGLRWALTLVFLGYTFLVPGDIFEAVGWWITFGFLFAAYMVQGIVFALNYGKQA